MEPDGIGIVCHALDYDAGRHRRPASNSKGYDEPDVEPNMDILCHRRIFGRRGRDSIIGQAAYCDVAVCDQLCRNPDPVFGPRIGRYRNQPRSHDHVFPRIHCGNGIDTVHTGVAVGKAGLAEIELGRVTFYIVDLRFVGPCPT